MAEDNPYDMLIQGDAANIARTSMMDAVDKNPDTEVKLRGLAKQYKMPIDAIRVDQPFIERKAKLDAVNYDLLARDAPKTIAHLGDPGRAAISHDDVDNLSAFENAAKYVFGAGKRGLVTDVIGGAYFGAGGGAAGAFRAASEFIAPPLDFMERFPGVGGNPLRRLSEGFGQIANESQARLKAMSPQSGSFVGNAVSSGAQSFGQNLLMMPLALLPGGQAAALAGMSAQSGGQSYQKAREKGVSQNTALMYGASDAAIEFATEKLPMSRLIGDLRGGTTLAKTLLRQAAVEIPGEQIATVMQDMNEWAVLHPEKPFSAYLAERPSAAAQTLIATLVGTGGNVTVMHAIESTLNSGGRERAQAARDAALIKQLTELSAASKVLTRDTATFEVFAQSLTEEGATDLWISPDALAQSGVADQVMALSPEVADQVRASVDSGADIRIPIAEFMGRMSKEGVAQALVDHVKTDPQGFSKTEADVYMQEHGETLNAEVEKVLSLRAGDTAFAASRAAVQADLTDKLNAAGRFTPDVNGAYSTLMANFFATQASRLGVTPEALYQQYTPSIVAESVGGAVLDQSINLVLDKNGRIVRAPGEGVKANPDQDAFRQALDAGDKAAALESLARIRSAEGRAVTAEDRMVVEQRTAPPTKPAPSEAIIALRNRVSVLESLKACL